MVLSKHIMQSSTTGRSSEYDDGRGKRKKSGTFDEPREGSDTAVFGAGRLEVLDNRWPDWWFSAPAELQAGNQSTEVIRIFGCRIHESRHHGMKNLWLRRYVEKAPSVGNALCTHFMVFRVVSRYIGNSCLECVEEVVMMVMRSVRNGWVRGRDDYFILLDLVEGLWRPISFRGCKC